MRATRPLLAVLMIAAAAWAATPLDPLAGARFTDMPPAVATVIADPRTTEELGGFGPIVLSHVAEGCVDRAIRDPSAHDDAVRCVESVRRGLPDTLPAGSVWLAHALIVEESAVRLGLPSERDAAIAKRLAKLSLADPNGVAPSYPGEASRWPADQAAALYALWLYDGNHGTDLHVKPLAVHDAAMAGHVDPATGLPMSEIAGVRGYGPLPRGCALSWTVRYRAPFDPIGAQSLWTTYRDVYFVDYGAVGGLREWPPGIDRPMDADSGPIVLGIGSAATGIGLVAAKNVGDGAVAGRIARASASGHALFDRAPEIGEIATGPVAAAIEWKAAATGADWFAAEAARW